MSAWHLGPPRIDPAYFPGSSLSTQTHRTIERALLADFRGRLSATGFAGYEFDASFGAHREGVRYGVYLFRGLSSPVA